MKITIYELFVKIANDKETPKFIRYKDKIYKRQWGDYMGDEPIDEYYEDENGYSWFDNLDLSLDSEVEIIEEDKKMKKIKSNGDEFYSDYIDTWISKNKTDAYCEFLMNKINDIIDEINNLKKEK